MGAQFPTVGGELKLGKENVLGVGSELEVSV